MDIIKPKLSKIDEETIAELKHLLISEGVDSVIADRAVNKLLEKKIIHTEFVLSIAKKYRALFEPNKRKGILPITQLYALAIGYYILRSELAQEDRHKMVIISNSLHAYLPDTKSPEVRDLAYMLKAMLDELDAKMTKNYDDDEIYSMKSKISTYFMLFLIRWKVDNVEVSIDPVTSEIILEDRANNIDISIKLMGEQATFLTDIQNSTEWNTIATYYEKGKEYIRNNPDFMNYKSHFNE